MVHCLLLPFVLAFAPTPAMAHFLPANETVHRSLAYPWRPWASSLSERAISCIAENLSCFF